MINFLIFSLLITSSVVFASSSTDSTLKSPLQDRGAKQVHHDHIVRLPMRRRPPTIATRIIPPDPNRVVLSESSISSPPPVNLNTTAFFKDVAYGVKMWIGEPPQAVTLDFDTGSSETWLDPPCTILGLYPLYEALCRSLGTYIPQQSQHSLDNNVSCPPHWVYYGSGEVFIRYYKDKIAFQVSQPDILDFNVVRPEIQIGSAQFGLAIFSEGMPSGIFGAAYGVGYNQNYSSIIDEMYTQGLILDKDFSIALGSVDEDNENNGPGELLFGALDLAKFTGTLKGIDIASQHSRREDGYYRYWINVTSIGVTEPGSCLSIPLTNSTFEERFLPDTGTTLTYMPRDALLGLLEFFPEATVEEGYGYKIDCSHLDEEGTINFGFGSGDFTIRVPYRDFIFQLQPGVEEPDQKEVVCMLGAVPSEGFYILGDTFMRSVYAVFRQQEHKVYLAPYQNCGTEIVSSHGEISELFGVCIPGESSDPPELYGFPPSASSSAATATCSSYSTGTYSPPQTSTGAATWQADTPPKSHMFPRPAIQTGDPHNYRWPAKSTPTHATSSSKTRTTNTKVHPLQTTTAKKKKESSSKLKNHHAHSSSMEHSTSTTSVSFVLTTVSLEGATLKDTTLRGLTLTLSIPASEITTEAQTDPYKSMSTSDCDTETETSWASSTADYSSSSCSTKHHKPHTTTTSTSHHKTSPSRGGYSFTTSSLPSVVWGTSLHWFSGTPIPSSQSSEWIETFTVSGWSTTYTSTTTYEEGGPIASTVSFPTARPMPTPVPFSLSSYTSGISWQQTPEEITIAVATPNTIIVELESTTYSLVDGTRVWPSAISSYSESWMTFTTETEEITATTQSRVFTRSLETFTTESPPSSPSSLSSSSSTEVDGYVTLMSWTPVEGPPPPTDLPRAAGAAAAGKFYQHDYAAAAVKHRRRSKISSSSSNEAAAVEKEGQVVVGVGKEVVEDDDWEKSVPRFLIDGCVGMGMDKRGLEEGSVRENVVGFREDVEVVDGG
ncbi:aspartic peptidase domain-containing protein [Cercophora scortea]|uniref:Aspartic peptidase domain-containing protein n=1 Tax=Cercophora scortea TaxID=314031 RepID=A0AAE0I2H2_9PEZI|nr:aspartic peptidase domain-containing protein [Cercophora scortea]